MISGIDVSHYQEVLDWPRIKEYMPQIRFVYHKATQGLKYIDPCFKENRAGAIGIGVPFGAYHFLDYFNYAPGKEIYHGEAQAEFHFQTISDNAGQLPPAIDVETNEGADWPALTIWNINRVWKIKLAFYNRMAKLCGRYPMSYESGWTAAYDKNMMSGGLWVPRYRLVKNSSGDLVQPSLNDFETAANLALYYPKPKTGVYGSYIFWQYSSAGRGYAFGMKTNQASVDLNVYNGTEEEFSILCGNGCIPTYPSSTEDSSPAPIILNEMATVIARDGVNIRVGVGTSSPLALRPNYSKMVMPYGTIMTVLGKSNDSEGNPWVRIGLNQWACVNYRGLQILKISEVAK